MSEIAQHIGSLVTLMYSIALEAEGKALKGRMRERIAEILRVSPAQVGKIENIRHNAIEDVHEAVKNGEMSISTANEVAKLTPEKQREIVAEKPKITHKEVKEIQQEQKEIFPAEEEYEEPEQDESTEDYNVFSFSDEKEISESQSEDYEDNEPVTLRLTAEESGVLAKCIDNILANKTYANDDEGKVLLDVIRKLGNA